MSHLWKKVQDEMVNEKTFTKKESDKNPKVPRNVTGFCLFACCLFVFAQNKF